MSEIVHDQRVGSVRPSHGQPALRTAASVTAVTPRRLAITALTSATLAGAALAAAIILWPQPDPAGFPTVTAPTASPTTPGDAIARQACTDLATDDSLSVLDDDFQADDDTIYAWLTDLATNARLARRSPDQTIAAPAGELYDHIETYATGDTATPGELLTVAWEAMQNLVAACHTAGHITDQQLRTAMRVD